MNLEVEAYEGELKKLRELNDLYTKIYKHTFGADKGNNAYFICGELGPKDSSGLPDKILVCPAYGVDFFHVYQDTGEVHGTEW